MDAAHYFSPDDTAPADLRSRDVTLRGRPHTVTTGGSVFSAGGLDKATAVLLEEVPDPPPAGTLLDLGCGWGPIALALADASPGADVLAVDVNRRALDLTARNAGSAGHGRTLALSPDDALDRLGPDGRVDAIWSNPPVRVGKQALHDLLDLWLPRLAPGALAHLVVGKNLGADSLHRWLADERGWAVERLGSSKGFRILVVAGRAAAGVS
ncbi:class I SAM-dependent methyltransferase [Georgenia sp. Z1491]|uniref:class I SAM-dependent methyltransferase n=1 Tax=Georgenia sp. Z1491 TaxID=3416707 RepID=UPI003CE8C9E9